ERSLYDYQDKNLAKRYFETAKSLQWNHYLVFLVENEFIDKDFIRLKTIIEGDKNFTRKFLLHEKELDAFIKPREWQSHKTEKPDVIVNVWLDILDKNGLSNIYSEKPRKHVVDGILADWRIIAEQSNRDVSKSHKLAGKTTPLNAIKFIEKLQKQHYRQFPPQNQFDFGLVNLINGANGTGKTSLLEAIEYFHCGQNRRSVNRETTLRPKITVQFKGEKSYTTINNSPIERRKRDLEWFGTYGRRTDDLNSNFNRYIFFNSDASYFLEHSEENADITTALVRLALGEDVNKFWGQINEYATEFRKRLPGLSERSRLLRDRFSEIDKLLSQLKKPTVVLDVLFERLVKALNESKIKKIPKNPVEVSSSFVDSILDLEGFTRAVYHLNWIDTLTIENIYKNKDFHEKAIKEFEDIAKEENKIQIAEIQTKQDREEANNRKDILKRIKRYVTANWESKWKEEQELEQIVSETQLISTSLDAVDLKKLPDEYSHFSISGAFRHLAQKLSRSETELTTKEEELSKVQTTFSEIKQTVVEIQTLGMHYLKNAPHATDCPLCGTRFSETELKRRLSKLADLESIDEKKAKEIVADVAAIKKIIRELKQLKAMLQRLEELAVKLNLPKSTLISELLEQAKIKVQTLDNLQSQLKTLRSFFKRLKDDNYSEDEYRELQDEIYGYLGKPKRDDRALDLKWLQFEQSQVEQALVDVTTKMESNSNGRKQLLRRIKELVRSLGKPAASVDEALTVVKERLILINVCLEQYRRAINYMQIERADSLNKILRGIGALTDLVKDFANVKESEKLRNSQLEQATADLQQIEKERSEVDGRLACCKSVNSVLEKIIKKHSIESVVQEFISTNQERISEIFSSIHAPREFAGVEHLRNEKDLGGELRLVKINNGSESYVSVSEISAGQRAALALSIFLCLNEKLENAPPLMLFDDPVAHVDDMNALSFLDFLRDIVLSNTRQIFFSTADDKLAALFERKFDFLGSEFKRFPLSR
ncbi:MAG TPA: hypothetical protein VLX29_03075, partial [Nitrospirota bacterium]|nr:hypothetical protein [Nitrospirota bacterium]